MNRDLRLLAYELGQAFATHRELPDLIAFAVARCRELLAAEGVAILLLDRENDELYIPYVAEENPQVAAQLSRVRLPAYRGVAGKVLRTARSLRVDDTTADRSFFPGVDARTQRTTRSIVCAPLVAAHGTLGVIEAVNPCSGGHFTDDDLALLDALAETIADAIDRAARRTPDAAAPSEAGVVAQARSGVADETGGARDHAFHRQGEYWTIVYDGETLRLKHAKGLAYIAYLLHHPGEEFHALDLINAVDGEQVEPARDRSDATQPPPRRLGDAGEILDTQAKASYKRRLDDLREELEEAREFNDPARAEGLQQEIEFLTQELARAVGIGGRERRAGSHAERARVNVTRAITGALQKIAEHHPSLARHFSATIKTGTFCSYVPDPRVPVGWVL